MSPPLRWALIGASDIAATQLLTAMHRLGHEPGSGPLPWRWPCRSLWSPVAGSPLRRRPYDREPPNATSVGVSPLSGVA
jgi:hypothetical protein